jgi:ferredoxin
MTAGGDTVGTAMADRTDKNPRNVSGPYYNDTTCIDCDICRDIAPENFRRDEESEMSYVGRQPATEEEIALAEEAIETCPTATIGRDGAE